MKAKIFFFKLSVKTEPLLPTSFASSSTQHCQAWSKQFLNSNLSHPDEKPERQYYCCPRFSEEAKAA